MLYLLIAVIIAMVALTAGGAYLYYRRARRRKVINDILFDVNPLAVWTYSPEEWRRAVQEELLWGHADDGPVQVRISRFGVYFKTRSREHLVALADGTKIVTFAGYGGAEGNPLKLRTRWRVITHDRYGNEQIHYYKEDYRIPVPLREQAAAQNVVNYFTKWLEDNPRFYTQMLPDDEPISLFAKDSF
jgi:hypothetical protein